MHSMFDHFLSLLGINVTGIHLPQMLSVSLCHVSLGCPGGSRTLARLIFGVFDVHRSPVQVKVVIIVPDFRIPFLTP